MQKNEKVLILRTAKMQVIDLLMKQINQENDITFLVQNNAAEEIKQRYPFVKVIPIMENYFNYKSFCRNITLTEKYDVVYVPASGMTFDGYEEVFSILEKIKYRKLVLFNGKGEENVEWNTIGKNIQDFMFFIFVRIYMKYIDIWYECFGRKYRF